MLITGFVSGSCPSKEVATIETLIFPFKVSSSIEPNINSASGSTSALILFTASSTSNIVRSLPPVIFTKRPLAPFKEYSSIKGLFNAALNNPIIDEYSLKGAKGLLVNITGGNDLTMFEVDEAVNKIRAEVDPEAELIFGSIEDETLNGKIRVSIVATSLDGQEPQMKPIISMVGRIQNRNSNYSETSPSSFKTQNTQTIMATEGATALNIEPNPSIDSSVDENKIEQNKNQKEDMPFGDLSKESANYLQRLEENTQVESSSEENRAQLNSQESTSFEVDSIELATPQLFSNDEEINFDPQEQKEKNQPDIFENQISQETSDEKEKEQEMFDNLDSEEDFEIPAFLRKQKD